MKRELSDTAGRKADDAGRPAGPYGVDVHDHTVRLHPEDDETKTSDAS